MPQIFHPFLCTCEHRHINKDYITIPGKSINSGVVTVHVLSGCLHLVQPFSGILSGCLDLVQPCGGVFECVFALCSQMGVAKNTYKINVKHLDCKHVYSHVHTYTYTHTHTHTHTHACIHASNIHECKILAVHTVVNATNDTCARSCANAPHMHAIHTKSI
jgi:hypothetical protein